MCDSVGDSLLSQRWQRSATREVKVEVKVCAVHPKAGSLRCCQVSIASAVLHGTLL